MLSECCLCCYGRASGWKSKRLYGIMEDCSCLEKEVRADDKRTAWLGFTPHLLLRCIPSPSLASSAFALTFDSHTALAWYPHLRQTNEDVSLSLKTMAVTKRTASFPSSFLPSHPLPPPQQMDRGESQTVFFKSISTSVLCARVYGLMKWQSFSTELAPLKLPAALQKYLYSVPLLHGEMGVRGHTVVNDSNEIWAKVWLGLVSLPCVISYFQTAHHREGKK